MATKKPGKKDSSTKAGAKRKVATALPAMRHWDLKYPDFPNLFSNDKLEDCDAIFRQAGQFLGSSVLSGDAGKPWEHHHAALLCRFAERVHAGEEIEPFILKFLAAAFWNVLHGMPLDDAIRLPGRPRPPEWQTIHPKDQRDVALFFDVSELIEGGKKVTDAINAIAKTRNLSMETVRKAYYDQKKRDQHGREISNSQDDK